MAKPERRVAGRTDSRLIGNRPLSSGRDLVFQFAALFTELACIHKADDLGSDVEGSAAWRF